MSLSVTYTRKNDTTYHVIACCLAIHPFENFLLLAFGCIYSLSEYTSTLALLTACFWMYLLTFLAVHPFAPAENSTLLRR